MNVAMWLVLIACGIAVASDLKVRRIPNGLSAALAIAGLALGATHGFHAFVLSLACMLAVFMLGLIAFSNHWLGGGDVKLMAAAAATLGYPDAIAFVVYTSLGGGLIALVVAAVHGRLRSTLDGVMLVVRPLLYKGTVAIAPRPTFTMPYALAIGFGALAVVVMNTFAPTLRLAL